MCHQTVGLIQNAIEGAGISTISVTLIPHITYGTCVPRAVSLRFPLGNPTGEPHQPEQQTIILKAILKALVDIKEPGTIVELPFRWRRVLREASTSA